MGKYELNFNNFVVRAVSARKNGNVYLSDKLATRTVEMAQDVALKFKAVYPHCDIEILSKKGKILEVL